MQDGRRHLSNFVKVDEEDRALKLLLSLPKSYENLVQTLILVGDTLTMDDTRTSLLADDLQKDKALIHGTQDDDTFREPGHVSRNAELTCPGSLGKQSPTIAEDKAYMENVPYASAVFRFNLCHGVYTSSHSQAVSVVSTFMANPGNAHWEAVKWILRYLKGTIATGELVIRAALEYPLPSDPFLLSATLFPTSPNKMGEQKKGASLDCQVLSFVYAHDGRRTIPVDHSLSAPLIQVLHRNSSPSNVAQSVTPPISTDKPSIRAPQTSSHNGNRVVLSSNGTRASNQNSTGESSVSDSNMDTGLNSSDILEKARVAITSAERASAAARAAAQLANVNFGSLKVEGKS
uniref:Uncharacterized protein n=1 Tax=Chenopodium quinoa TaxID=63459 RepID=A0A803MTY8_CHEQI